MLGYSKDEMIGMNYRRYTDRENAKKFMRPLIKSTGPGNPSKDLVGGGLLKTGQSFSAKFQYLIKDSKGHSRFSGHCP